MRSDQQRSDRIYSLCKFVIKLAEQGKSSEYMRLALKSKITQMGVSKGTANDYFDTVVGRVSK